MLADAVPMPARFNRPAVEAAAFVRWLRTHRSALWVAGLLPATFNFGFFVSNLGVLEEVTRPLVMTGLYRVVPFSAVGFVSFVLTGYLFLRLTHGGWRAAAFGFALALCAAAVSASMAYAHGWADMLAAIDPGPAFALDTFAQTLSMALVNLAFLRHAKVREDAARRLSTAKAAQREAGRRLALRHLQAVQARIDPQLLFDMLDAVRRAYETEPERAELLLDQLVAFLRAALPRLQQASSSVPREAEIVRAFVRLHELAGTAEGGVRIEVAPDLMDARFPPGVLLPIFDDALRARRGRCVLQAARDAGGGASRITLALPAAPSPATLERVRALLDRLYGPAAALRAEPAAPGARVTLEVPHERA